MATVNRQLVVFDFDWSMADQDTDRWIFEVLAPDIRRKMKNLKDEIQWTDLVAQCLQDIYSRGVTKEQIEHALRIIPFHPAMIRAIENLHESSRTTFFILSNANQIFISTILEEKGLQNLFEEVITNSAEWDPSGLLKVSRRIHPDGPQHKCTVGCSPNMCKGDELEAFIKRHSPTYDRIIYIGDGSNDYCPALHLRSQDMLLCRSFRGLQKRINEEGGLVCEVLYWNGAWEVEEIFAKL